MESGDRIVVVDLGELSKTKFSDSIIAAHFSQESGKTSLNLRTNSVTTDLNLKAQETPGTYILYDAEGKLVGITDEEYTME